MNKGQLKSIISDADGYFKIDKIPSEVFATVKNPRFDNTPIDAKSMDWRNFVPSNFRQMWKEFSIDAKVIIYMAAQAKVPKLPA